MKRIVSVVMALLFCVFLGACSTNGNTAEVNVTIGESEHFSEEELQAAADAVIEKFSADFEGCTLTDLWYTEEDSDCAVAGYMSGGRGSVNGVDSANVVVFYSNFDVDESGGDGSLNPNSTESGWSWILIRDSADGAWTVDDWGY